MLKETKYSIVLLSISLVLGAIVFYLPFFRNNTLAWVVSMGTIVLSSICALLVFFEIIKSLKIRKFDMLKYLIASLIIIAIIFYRVYHD